MSRIMTLTLVFLFSFNVWSNLDYDSLCVDSVLQGASQEVRRNNKFLSDFKTLVSYHVSGSERVQTVYTDTGKVETNKVTNQHEKRFICISSESNVEKTLSQKTNELFEEVYHSKASQAQKKAYLSSVFSSCNRSSFGDLKVNINRRRVGGREGQPLEAGATDN